MTSNKQKTLIRILALLCFPLSYYSSGLSVKACFDQAKNDTENLYCEILSRGKGQGLPNFNEFRRNPANTQRLLLTAPARQLGLPLPEIRSARSVSATATSKKEPETVAPPIPDTRSREGGTEYGQDAQKNSSIDSQLTDCRVEKDRIACSDALYYLTVNVPLSRLNPEALAESNRLRFSEKASDQTDQRYLSALYPYYIEKMLLLGLGDSTMSFTKFNALYQQSKNEGNFTARFGTMYDLLKQERQSMAIKQRYRNNYPQDIGECMSLNDRLIACDNVEQNWVYQRLTDE